MVQPVNTAEDSFSYKETKGKRERNFSCKDSMIIVHIVTSKF